MADYSPLALLRFMMSGQQGADLMASQGQQMNRIAADPQYFLAGSGLRNNGAYAEHLMRSAPADLSPDELRHLEQIRSLIGR